MMSSRFVPGAKVAIVHGDDVRSAVVDKVYKNGNFTLVGDRSKQQWRRSGDDWASPTGESNSYHQPHVVPWTAENEVELLARMERAACRRRLSTITYRISRLNVDSLSPEPLTAIEQALDAIDAAAKETA